MRAEVFPGESPEWKEEFYFRIRAGNGQIVAQSEGYASRSKARRAARRLILGIVNEVTNSFHSGLERVVGPPGSRFEIVDVDA